VERARVYKGAIADSVFARRFVDVAGYRQDRLAAFDEFAYRIASAAAAFDGGLACRLMSYQYERVSAGGLFFYFDECVCKVLFQRIAQLWPAGIDTAGKSDKIDTVKIDTVRMNIDTLAGEIASYFRPVAVSGNGEYVLVAISKLVDYKLSLFRTAKVGYVARNENKIGGFKVGAGIGKVAKAVMYIC
jgi:hypothetical protein